jgi:hypothetical protein
MRGAFERALTQRVANALDHVQETAGEEAVARLRAAGHDRFELRGFRKQDCLRSGDGRGYVCSFETDVALASGLTTTRVQGRFRPGTQGMLVFAEDL